MELSTQVHGMNDEQLMALSNDSNHFEKISFVVWSDDQNPICFIGVANVKVVV
jgi:hypothetical protein